jgi:hypothetical protein
MYTVTHMADVLIWAILINDAFHYIYILIYLFIFIYIYIYLLFIL